MGKETILVTGSGGLIGSESVTFFIEKGFDVVGIDNDMRKYFFGDEGSTAWNVERLEKIHGEKYIHFNADIRDFESIKKIFAEYKPSSVIHTAAQPSHDWAAKEPFTDFSVNANGTLNLIELEKRYELPEDHPYYYGIDETMSIDDCLHSLFGASKVAADVLVQEYGRYFGMKTVSFRGGCLTGPSHSGAMLHGFLSYLVRCAITGKKYYIYGYKGKQVRDNIHSYDLVNAFYHFLKKPRIAEVYNMGGSRFSQCSMLEAIDMVEKISGKKMNYEYKEQNRIGDHIWYISSVAKFKSHFPGWEYERDLDTIFRETYEFQMALFDKGAF
jgi:CDP-paratose 2-epimerase